MEAAWVSAISALLSLGVVVFQQWREARRRNREEAKRQIREDRAQAEQIAAWIEGDIETDGSLKKIIITLQNSSDVPVYLATFVLVPLKGAEAKPGEAVVYSSPEMSASDVISVLAPGRTKREMICPAWQAGTRVGIELAFFDAGRRSWVRRGDGRLQGLDGKDPRIGRVFDGSAMAGEKYHPEGE